MPTVKIMGSGGRADAGQDIQSLGFKRALIVTDVSLHQELKATKVLTGLLNKIGVACAIYVGVEPNPTTAQVDAGTAILRQEGCDPVVSFGGGSAKRPLRQLGSSLLTAVIFESS
ncbi:MAG: iron-containing alcohol dehydrogenase [Pseudomonadota bacterium]